MRILHLDPDDVDNPVSGGGPIRTLQLYRRIAKHHEVTVLTPTFAGSTPELVRDGIRYLRLGHKIRNHGSSHHITYLFKLPAAVRRIAHDLLVEDFMPPCGATHVPLFRRRNAPHIASLQWFSAWDYTRKLKLPFHWGQQVGLKLYDNFIVLTPSMQQTVQRWNPRARTAVIPNGVDDELFQVPIEAGQGILFLGRVEIGTKGIDLLLESYARLPAERRPRLTIAGTLQEPELLQACLQRWGLEGQVNLFGRYSPDQRRELLRSHRCLAMPSRIETFGMTIAEANAAGKPAVVWDQAPMNEVSSAACWRVRPYDIEAYSHALMQACAASDHELLCRGAQAREQARRFNWDTVAAAQMAVYEELRDRWLHARAR
ncbi:MAG: glycosyltransferase family 4 protein [Ideonella sp.]|nr:glycosyltransferase family 4 protein [Ideonella sp.]